MKTRQRIKSREIMYDSLSDTLTARFDGRNTSHSLNIHDLMIVDFSETNKLAGIELLDVSEIYDLNKSQLKKINLIMVKTVFNLDTKELVIFTTIEYKDGSKEEHKQVFVSPPIKIENSFSVVA
ncbi:MAG: DUF2283 domain-containing protein [Nanoarchaeota archaeon]